VFIFPGVGLGVLATGTPTVTDSMFLAAARSLAGETLPEDIAVGSIYPSLKRIREVSFRVAVATAREAIRLGLATCSDENLEEQIAARMFSPKYIDLA
jgi:malate dehydrogenase (oxaloacetate-decarboxylating)(NADP+)